VTLQFILLHHQPALLFSLIAYFVTPNDSIIRFHAFRINFLIYFTILLRSSRSLSHVPKHASSSHWYFIGTHLPLLLYCVTPAGYCSTNPSHVVPGTAAIAAAASRWSTQVEVKSMNHRPAADCTPCRRRRR